MSPTAILILPFYYIALNKNKRMNKNLQNKVYGYLITRLRAFEYKGSWLKLPTCPFCGGEEKLGINLVTNYVHCFKCEHRSGVIDFIQKVEGIHQKKEVYRFLGDFTSYEYTPPPMELLEELPVILPKGYVNIRRGETGVGKLARKYLLSRGFSLEYLGKRGIGYVQNPEEGLYGFIIIPFYKDKKLVYFQTRRFLGDGPKYKNPAVEDFGIGKQTLIYNIDSLNKRFKQVSLFEGAFNALTLGEETVAIQGKVLSLWQRSRILTSKVSLINICLDFDALEYAFRIAMELVPYKAVRVVVFPDGEDANDLGKEKTLKLIEETEIIKTYKDLKRYESKLYREIKNN